MKKITVILLLICYLMPAIGMTVVTHYCGGKLTSVSLQLSGTEKCPCGSKKMKKDCCKTKTCTFKIKDEQQQAPQLSVDFNKTISFQPAIIHTCNATIFCASVEKDFHTHHPPPDKIKQPLYLLNQVFRI